MVRCLHSGLQPLSICLPSHLLCAVGGTLVCTLLGAVLFARGVAQVPFLMKCQVGHTCTLANPVCGSQNPAGDGQFREQVVAKRRRIKPVKKAEEPAIAAKEDTPDL